MHRLFYVVAAVNLYMAGKVAYCGYHGFPLNGLMTTAAVSAIAFIAMVAWGIARHGDRM